MGKRHKTNNQKANPSKNIFKVVGSRALKAKNKAKPVAVQLKNLDAIKVKTAEVDRQLDTLQVAVRQSTKKADGVEKDGTGNTRLIEKDVKQFEESEKKSKETLEKLTDMSM